MGSVIAPTTGETETTIVDINNNYILTSGIRATRVYSNPGIVHGKPAILLFMHPDYDNIHKQLLKNTTHKFKWTWDIDLNVGVIDSISSPDEKMIEGCIADILSIYNSDKYEIIMHDPKENLDLTIAQRKTRLICDNEIKKLITVNKFYTLTYIKDYDSNKYRILSVKSH